MTRQCSTRCRPRCYKGSPKRSIRLPRRRRPPRCLVLTGVGRAFSTGANLQGRGGNNFSPRGAGRTLETLFHPFMLRLRDLPYPIVTAVNGPAAGAGMSLALMGDLIVCARSAYFLQAFRRIGLVPDCGSTWLLPRLVGRLLFGVQFCPPEPGDRRPKLTPYRLA